MFRAKQVQTLDVDKIMEQILENHDAKVTVDKLTEFLNRELENALAVSGIASARIVLAGEWSCLLPEIEIAGEKALYEIGHP